MMYVDLVLPGVLVMLEIPPTLETHWCQVMITGMTRRCFLASAGVNKPLEAVLAPCHWRSRVLVALSLARHDTMVPGNVFPRYIMHEFLSQ